MKNAHLGLKYSIIVNNGKQNLKILTLYQDHYIRESKKK
jgi:hypothetical protein